ncbi:MULTISPECIES: hypothetical protein [unclassified Mesorhizobium]|uniref:hypothetical protein n=1 Tax=unclassified Mesorhizobium TaxID=325217 RepID=UPI001FEDA0D8|nr:MULTISPECIES: hypothetical protein [unclassified Mesorhizobium]
MERQAQGLRRLSGQGNIRAIYGELIFRPAALGRKLVKDKHVKLHGGRGRSHQHIVRACKRIDAALEVKGIVLDIVAVFNRPASDRTDNAQRVANAVLQFGGKCLRRLEAVACDLEFGFEPGDMIVTFVHLFIDMTEPHRRGSIAFFGGHTLRTGECTRDVFLGRSFSSHLSVFQPFIDHARCQAHRLVGLWLAFTRPGLAFVPPRGVFSRRK